MRYFIVILASFIFLTGISQEALSKRIALVIGNSAYENTSSLANPKNDADLVGNALKRLGFEVTILGDATQKQMKRGVRDYFNALRQSGPQTVGLVFYAGHGVQVRGSNYLIPVDAQIKHESDVDIEAFSAASLLAGMRSIGNRLNIVLFDACRNNPYRSSFRSQSRGLARMDAPKGSFIAFATSPGDVAADGEGRNSPFSKALAHNLAKSGMTIEQIIKKVGSQVEVATRGKQLPWYSSSVYTDFYLTPKKRVEPSFSSGGWSAEVKFNDRLPVESGRKATTSPCAGKNPPISCLWKRK